MVIKSKQIAILIKISKDIGESILNTEYKMEIMVWKLNLSVN